MIEEEIKKQKQRENAKKYYAENKKRALEKHYEWQRKNKDKVHEYQRKYRENNPNKLNGTYTKYKATLNKLKDEMLKDRMEQFDDYVIYLLNKYLEILGENKNE